MKTSFAVFTALLFVTSPAMAEGDPDKGKKVFSKCKACHMVGEKAKTPTHSVFNGAVGSMTGTNAYKSEVCRTILIVHAQANRDTRPHLIGGHADIVWEGGSFTDVPQTGLETWFIRGGSAGAAMYTFKQPGIYAYVNYNLIEASLKGAATHFVVEGEWDNDLMAQIVPARSFG